VRKEGKTKDRKKDGGKGNREASALLLAVASFFSAYIFIVPSKSGIVGEACCSVAFGVFGTASYFLPLIFLWYFIMYIKWSVKAEKRFDFTWSALCVICGAVLFAAVHFVFMSEISGGWLGDKLYPFFKELFGERLSFAVVALLFFFSVSKLLGFSADNLLKSLREKTQKLKGIKLKDIETQDEDTAAVQQGFGGETHKVESTKPNIISKPEKEEGKKRDNYERTAAFKRKKSGGKNFDYKLPFVDMLEYDSVTSFGTDKDGLFERAKLLRTALADFGINAEVKDIIPGPVVTRYDLVLAPGIRIQTVSSIVDNISLIMRTASIRIIPVPEKAAVGIEVPNLSGTVVGLRGILESSAFRNSKSLLTLALGKTTDGLGYVTNLASMPHLLIAGATGSGKSVGIHAIILSILYKARPDEVKFMLIDPKRVEMPIYRDIPHVYNPCTCAAKADIITKPREAAAALKKLVGIMDERYTKFAKEMVRNIEDYNDKMTETGGEKEFYIVVVIDELADLMLVAQREIEDSIQRLAQMARAVGIHLILATQRPSVNIITGIIKANFPARLSFQTTSKVDSRVILDMLGAECLIGKGDMLFLPPCEAKPVRLQGAYVSLREAEKVVSFINSQNFPRIYEPSGAEFAGKCGSGADGEKMTEDLISALKLINERKRVSHDLLKANFGGSAKATNILSILETEGFIAKPEGTNKWQIDYGKVAYYLDNRVGKSE